MPRCGEMGRLRRCLAMMLSDSSTCAVASLERMVALANGQKGWWSNEKLRIYFMQLQLSTFSLPSMLQLGAYLF